MSEEKGFRYSYASPKRDVALEEPEKGQDSPLRNKSAVRGAVLWGIASCLIFGTGLTCVLEWSALLPGLLLGLSGIAGMAVAPALYRRLLARPKASKPTR